MHDKIESLAFWRTVKKEYLANSEEFLCFGSKTFRNIWDEDVFSPSRSALAELGKLFLKQINSEYSVSSNINRFFARTLFEIQDEREGRLVREKFIDWNIKRLS